MAIQGEQPTQIPSRETRGTRVAARLSAAERHGGWLEQAHCVAKAKFGPAGGGLVGLWQEYGWLTGEPGTEVVRHSDATRWWTFAGLHANASLAPALAEATGGEATECGQGSGLVFPGNGGGSLPVTARRCSVAPASCLWGGVID